MNNGNSYLNTKRRKFLIKLVGATIGFSISSIQNITTSLVVAQRPIFNYAIRLVLASGLILIILLGLLNFVSAQQMLAAWRYVILVSTIFGAILTPSTDPLTQLLLSFAILLLYFSGVGILFLIKN